MARRHSVLVEDWTMHHDTPDHAKVDLLVRLAGEAAYRAWHRLIACFCSGGPGGDYSGRFTGWDVRRIEIEARWAGTPGSLVAALKEAGLMDEAPDGVLELHDFADNNPHVAATPDRLQDATQQRTRAGLISAAMKAGTWSKSFESLPLPELREALDGARRKSTRGQRDPNGSQREVNENQRDPNGTPTKRNENQPPSPSPSPSPSESFAPDRRKKTPPENAHARVIPPATVPVHGAASPTPLPSATASASAASGPIAGVGIATNENTRPSVPTLPQDRRDGAGPGPDTKQPNGNGLSHAPANHMSAPYDDPPPETPEQRRERLRPRTRLERAHNRLVRERLKAKAAGLPDPGPHTEAQAAELALTLPMNAADLPPSGSTP